MGQEFTVKSENLENKINQLLPSQAGFGAGVDITASTTVIPIVDLTETAEGSLLRQDLQTAYGINSTFDTVNGTTDTIINTTGYYRLYGNYRSTSTGSNIGVVRIEDGFTTTQILSFASSITGATEDFDIVIFLKAGTSCTVTTQGNSTINVVHRQIADVNGNLINPS